jgi:hypothetical protein
MAHPLAAIKAATIDVEFGEESGLFVTYVRDLHGMSTFGETYIQSMEANHKKIPLGAARLKTLKRLVGACRT